MPILVIAEHDNAGLKAATRNTVAAARALDGELHVLVAGSDCAGACAAAAALDGVAKVLCADAAHYAEQGAENLAALIVSVAGTAYSHLLAPATTFGKNVMPRVAALLDVAQVSEIVAVESADTFVRPIYAGNALATVRSSDAVKVITVRTTAFDAVGDGGTASVWKRWPVVTAIAQLGRTRGARAPGWHGPASRTRLASRAPHLLAVGHRPDALTRRNLPGCSTPTRSPSSPPPTRTR